MIKTSSIANSIKPTRCLVMILMFLSVFTGFASFAGSEWYEVVKTEIVNDTRRYPVHRTLCYKRAYVLCFVAKRKINNFSKNWKNVLKQFKLQIRNKLNDNLTLQFKIKAFSGYYFHVKNHFKVSEYDFSNLPA